MIFKQITLKQKLAFSASFAILIGAILVMAISFQSSLKRLDIELNQRLLSSTSYYNRYVTDWLSAKGSGLKSLPASAERDQLEKHLQQLRIGAGFDNVFLAFKDGSQKNANGVILPPGNDDPRKWGWYKNAMANPQEVFMDNPTIAAATGEYVVSLGKTVQVLGETAIVGADVQIGDIIEQLQSAVLPGTSYMFIATAKGTIFAHANTELLNKPLSSLDPALSRERSNLSAVDYKLQTMTVANQESYVYVAPIKGTRLQTIVVINKESVVAPLISALWEQLLATLIIVALCLLFFNLFCNYLFKPLKKVSRALEIIAQGGGDLTQRIEIDSNDEVGALATHFNQFMASLQLLIRDIFAQAEQLKHEAQESERRANESVKELELQQQEVSMVATAVTEMSSATQEIAQNAEQTAQAAYSSADYAEKGQSEVEKTQNSITNLAEEIGQATEVISELHQHAQDIDGILATIQGIADQTNLLALNAAIEAARAGDQGRGFAVVADEVRGLAKRTHSSTEEIQSMTAILQTSTNNAVALMNSSSLLAQGTVDDAQQAAQSLAKIKESVQGISDMATQIATASEEQNQVTSEITRNTTSIKDVTDKLTEDAALAKLQSSELNLQANALNAKVSTFQV
ncbi:MAG: methyl-accepting chemotaxis protein [Psychromonas sp.]|jgi:methyl-accepting chemotaxis protein|uniref:methyl-accepting chemotaxis protein n=1 Tax=Psychromonas sp. TaxID=1884585 RepID=UPI0039E4FCE5